MKYELNHFVRWDQYKLALPLKDLKIAFATSICVRCVPNI